jgi:hypothetical protein
MPILPGTTVVVPLAVLLGPLGGANVTVLRRDTSEVDEFMYQSSEHVDMRNIASKVHIIGPATWPLVFEMVTDTGVEVRQPVHDFDLTNLYRIDRFFQGACCPHLFARRDDQAPLRYLGEMFAYAPGQPQSFELEAPADTCELIICELEHETTHVLWLHVNGEEIASNLTLSRGDTFHFSVSPGDFIQALGYYVPLVPVVISPETPLWRNELVDRFLRGTV